MKRALFFALAMLLAGCEVPSQAQQPAIAEVLAVDRPIEQALISEEQAIRLLVTTLRTHQVADLECLAFASESGLPDGSGAAVWEITAREIHNAKCGGDPSVSPVRDRYQVSSDGEVAIYDVVNDSYGPL